MTDTATLRTNPFILHGPRGTIPSLVRTDDAWSSAILRLTLGFVMVPHGLQKTFGFFGGYGFTGSMSFFTDTMGLPWVLAFAVIAIELGGSIALIIGLGTRLAALGIGAVMVGAIATVHAEYGFLMNWAGTKAGEGFEYHLLAIGIAAALVLAGGGRWSIDSRLV